MSKQRYIRDEMWRDSWFYQLPAKNKLVWVYLLTNASCNVAGLYKLNRGLASSELGIKQAELEGVLNGFVEDKKLLICDEWVCLVNFYKHQTDSPKIKAGVKRILSTVPKEVLDYLYGSDTLCIEYRTLLNLTLLNSTLPNGHADFPEDLEDIKKYSPEDMAMAELLVELIQKNNPDWKLRGNMDTWAEHIEKLHRIDGRTYQQIEYMIRWVQADSFWQQNILSTAKLREKFNDLIPKLKASALKVHTQRQQARKPKVL